MQASTSGGSADADVAELTVTAARPPTPSVDTMVTAEKMRAIAVGKGARGALGSVSSGNAGEGASCEYGVLPTIEAPSLRHSTDAADCKCRPPYRPPDGP